MKSVKRRSQRTKQLTLIGVLGGISLVMGLTPLGFIPLGVARATLMHIPTIVAGIMGGPLVGAAVGLIFGVFSLVKNYVSPTVISFVFWNPIVSVLPRVLIGVVSHYVYVFFETGNKKFKRWLTRFLFTGLLVYLVYQLVVCLKDGLWVNSIINTTFIVLQVYLFYFIEKKDDSVIAVYLASIAGTLTNSVLVLGLIGLIYFKDYGQALGLSANDTTNAIVSVGIVNGLLEVTVAVVLVSHIVLALKRR